LLSSSSSSSPDAEAVRTEKNDALSSSPQLLQSMDDRGVLTITLNRPDQRNALNLQILDGMMETLQHISISSLPSSLDNNDTSEEWHVRAVIVQSHCEGGVFCSGHDVKEISRYIGSSSPGSKHLRKLFAKSSQVMQLLRSVPVPTIAAVQGLATAAGCQLACACDLAIASPLSSFALPGLRSIGLFCHTPAVEVVRSGLNQKIAMDMLLTGRVINAEEALKYGLISRISENPQKEAQDLAAQVTAQSAAVIGLGKQIFYDQQAKVDRGEAYAIASDAMVKNLEMKHTVQGIDSFLGKNKNKDEPHIKSTNRK